MKVEEEKDQIHSLVQKPNWSSSARNDLICSRHKNSKLSILIHEIEGFVIEESNLPFKDDSELAEVSEVQNEIQNDVKEDEHNQQNKEEKENELVIASTNSYPEDKDELMSLLPTKCKYCGNELPEQRAMWGKRFCSVSCGKKYSLQCSQRMRKALQRRTTQHSGPGRGRKPKQIKNDEDFETTPVRKGRGRGCRSSTSLHTPDTPNGTNYDNVFDDIDLNITFPPRCPLGQGLDEFDVDDELYDGDEPITRYACVPLVTWSIDEVVEYIRSIPGCENSAEIFAQEEVDGSALLLLKMEHMVQTMNIKLGPALKIASRLRDLKLEYGIQTRSKYLSTL